MATDTVTPDTIPIDELAKRLSISQAKAYELAQANEFPFPIIRIGGRILVSRRAYNTWLQQYDYQGEGQYDSESVQAS